jgi:hypothetical protein
MNRNKKNVWMALVVLAAATAVCGVAWIWTGDVRWAHTMGFPGCALAVEFVFLPLLLALAGGEL